MLIRIPKKHPFFLWFVGGLGVIVNGFFGCGGFFALGNQLLQRPHPAEVIGLLCLTTCGLLGLYYFFMQTGYTLAYTRTMVFLTLVMDNILLTFTGRSSWETLRTTARYPNPLAVPVLVISVLFICTIYFIPFARNLFGSLRQQSLLGFPVINFVL